MTAQCAQKLDREVKFTLTSIGQVETFDIANAGSVDIPGSKGESSFTTTIVNKSMRPLNAPDRPLSWLVWMHRPYLHKSKPQSPHC